MTYRIEEARLEHLDGICALFAQSLGAEYPRYDDEELRCHRRIWQEQIEADQHARGFIASDPDGHVIGYMDACVNQRAIGKPHVYGEIADLYVVPEARHDGVAAELLHAALTWLSQYQVPAIEFAEHPASAGAWQRRGWPAQRWGRTGWLSL